MKLIGNRVLVRPHTASDKTEGGLFIPDMAQRPSEVVGEVVALGELQSPEVNVGDTVLFSPHAGIETDAYGERMFVMRETDILAVIEEGQVE